VPVTGRLVRVQVAHDQQGASGRHPPRDPVVELELGHRRVGVVGRHQVELRVRTPGGEVRLDPPHLL